MRFHPSTRSLPKHRHLLAGALLVLLLAIPTGALAVPKTDVITLINGDVVTCEIKELIRGKLRVKTDNMGEIYVEWDKVRHLSSNYWFLVTLRDGSLAYGQLEDAEREGYLTVTFQERSRDVFLYSIVEIQPVRYSLWDRFTMSASVGFNWDKGSDVFQANVAASVKYSGAIYSWGTDLSGSHTDNGIDESTRRNSLNLWLLREISGRFSGNTNVGTERNDELGLLRRITAGLGVGYFLSRSNHLELSVLAGANVNREWATDESEPSNNAEGQIGTKFYMFYYDSPKSDITVSLDLYPSFTVSERYRFEGSISGRQEIVKDLFLKLEYYESQDSKPPSGASATSDRGIVFSLEWSK
jgi:hypothetical protein